MPRYGPHPSQFLELSTPVGPSRGTVLLLHGGFWRARHGLELMRPLVPSLLAAGFTVANAEYRRVGAGGGWPATADDVVAARAALGTDVIAVGHSAGAQLAVCLARRGGVRAVVSLAGVLDVVAAARDGLGEGAAAAFLGGLPDEVPEVYAAASPMALTPVGVPVTCLHAPADQRVPFAQSAAFTDATGDRLVTVAGDHFTPIDPGSAAWASALAEVSALAGPRPS
ncbi:alpha/beta hydrolase family protein [Actinokineospora spheciospongiae]|nr:alpha/beta fold hydrolase [Actinokineospora spheciospongiae]